MGVGVECFNTSTSRHHDEREKLETVRQKVDEIRKGNTNQGTCKKQAVN